MTNRSPHIALYLTVIYIFSFIMSSLPVSVMGETYVKTECTNKNNKIGGETLSTNSSQFKVTQHTDQKPQEKKAPEEFSRCSISTVFVVPTKIAVFPKLPVQIREVGFPTTLYQSPSLEKLENPPQYS